MTYAKEKGIVEDGEEEFDKDELAKKGVFIEMIDDPARLTPDRLAARAKRIGAPFAAPHI